MPHMNGFEVCEQLKADLALRDIPVIFISALHETNDKVKGFRIGGVDYVSKPFQLDEVYARVQTHLKLRQLQRQLSEHNDRLELQVAQRTQDLVNAYQRVQELSQLKGEFLSMISHEMRTPANGVMGLGHLLLDLCPGSDTLTHYADLFTQSSNRMLNLFDDVSLISDMDVFAKKLGVISRLPDLLVQLQNELPKLLITLEKPDLPDVIIIKGHEPLLSRALKTMILLAIIFSNNKSAVHLNMKVDAKHLHLRLALDKLSISSTQVDDFFRLGSDSRSGSYAEPLGLAPVVANQIVSAFGAQMRLFRESDTNGYLEAIFLREINLELPNEAVA